MCRYYYGEPMAVCPCNAVNKCFMFGTWGWVDTRSGSRHVIPHLTLLGVPCDLQKREHGPEAKASPDCKDWFVDFENKEPDNEHNWKTKSICSFCEKHCKQLPGRRFHAPLHKTTTDLRRLLKNTISA